MTDKYTFQFNKLVRDKAPEIMAREGIHSNMHIMSHESYIRSLQAKIIEEAKEVAVASDSELLEELADVLEVVYSLAKAHGFMPEDIELERIKKLEARGGFEKKIYVESVTTSGGGRLFNYLLSKPQEYPSCVSA